MTKKDNKDKVTILPVEDAIKAYEQDGVRNPDGYKIVRGRDGNPVEIVTIKGGESPIWAILVNGELKEQFQIRGELQSMEQAIGNLAFSHFFHQDVLQSWYEIKGIQRLDADVQKDHQGFLFGQPGETPETIAVNF